ncbi:MAG: hypothetical protein JWP00_1144 [Chloroflexi bacterium]|nr:hypothetical protein [Chloroflexota bacterium]
MWWLSLLALFLLLLPGIWGNFWFLGLALMAWIVVSMLNRLWYWRVTHTVRLDRNIPPQAFYGDLLDVEVTVHNGIRLPIPWLRLQDNIPGNLKATPRTEWLVSVRSQEKVRLNYKLECKHRGRYLIGPLDGRIGVLLDTGSDARGVWQSWNKVSRLVVYPQIVPLEKLLLPSRLPMGNMRTRQPLLPDPSRIAGVREYQSGDDPRQIDWRNTARQSQLMVKEFDRTRVLSMAIFLDLCPPDKTYVWQPLAETSIVVAASLAKRSYDLKQPVGLFSNGFDPGWEKVNYKEGTLPEWGRPEMPPHNGGPWLYEIMERLAGIEARPDSPGMEKLIGKWTSRLPWGSTIAVVTFEPYPALVTELSRLRKAGFSVMAIFTAAERHTSLGYDSIFALHVLGVRIYDISQPEQLSLSV